MLSPLILFLSHHICPKSLFIIKFAFLTLGSACCLSYVSSVIGLLFLLQVCLPNGNLSFNSIQRDCSRISSGHKFCFSAGFSFGERTGTWEIPDTFCLASNQAAYNLLHRRVNFCSKRKENCPLLGYYAPTSGNFLPAFRVNLSVLSS